MSSQLHFAVSSLDLVGIAPDGLRSEIRVGIGLPYYDSSHDAWRCPLALDGIDNRLPDLAGGSSFQALCMAVYYIRRRLLDTVERGIRLVIVFKGEDFDFPMEAYFPVLVRG